MDIIFSVDGGLHDSRFGKMLDPLHAVIQTESDLLEKRVRLVDSLFNVEKSNHYAETYEVAGGLSDFQAVLEGGEPETDGSEVTGKKVVENIEFMKRTVTTMKAMEDAHMKISPEMKRGLRQFIGKYFETRDRIASVALTNAEQKSIIVNKATVDLTTFDGHPLFYKAHKWGGKKVSGTQGNLFYLADGADAIGSVEYMEDLFNEASGRLRNMKDENGNPMGYAADVVRIPGNRLKLEKYLRKLFGSEYAGMVENATVNTQSGRYHLFVDPYWQSDRDVIDIMSSEANEAVIGNVFQNRSKLMVETRKDNGFNLAHIARCRFGVGFPNYKHICRVYLLDAGASMATAEKL
jgi:hypothetical protein